jgi:Spy/CpxP family protein refolding chaperone
VSRWAALALVFTLFVVGVCVGALGMHLYDAHWKRGPEPPGGERFIARLERELNLTDEQRQRIDEIVEESRREGDALHREMLPRVHEHMRATRQKIREVLTREQRARFEELNREHRRRAEHFFLGGGRGRGRGRRGPPLHGGP